MTGAIGEIFHAVGEIVHTILHALAHFTGGTVGLLKDIEGDPQQ